MNEMQQVLSKMLDAKVIATEVAGVIKEIVDGKHRLNEPLGPGYNVRDLRSCNGFWLVREVVDDMTGAFVGRLCSAIFQQAGIDTRTLPLQVMQELMTSTDVVHQEAVDLAIASMKVDLGDIEVDPNEKQALLAKVYSSQMKAKDLMMRYD